LLVLYTLSGCVALLYEVVWTRLLTLHLGHTVAAASTVLAAFMGGLATGALAAGARSNSITAPVALRTYAAIEIGVAAYALCIPSLLRLAQLLLAAAYDDGNGGWRFAALRMSVAVVIVGIPASAMGATYPLLVRAALARIGADALYAVNTAGAAAGALATGFALIPVFGIFRTTLVGATVGALVGGLAWRLAPQTDTEEPGPQKNTEEHRPHKNEPQTNTEEHRPHKDKPQTNTEKHRPHKDKPQKNTEKHKPRKDTEKHRSRTDTEKHRPGVATSLLAQAIVWAGVAGFTALALEVAWTRALAIVVGPTIYAFSAMLASFIIGLAAGSGAGSWLARRVADSQPWIAVCFAAGAVSTAFAIARLDDVTVSLALKAATPSAEWWPVFAAGFGHTLLLIGPFALCSGALFPLTLALARGASSPRNAAIVYSANTAGAIAGALGAGLVLIPRLGLLRTIQTAAALSIVAAVASGAARIRARIGLSSALAALVVVAALLLTRSAWDPELMSSGGYKYAPYIGERDLRDLLTAGTLRYYREGTSATVAVRDLAGIRALSIDGKVDASTGTDMLTQRLLAHLPLLMHPAPSHVAIIGLGSGVTLASALTHQISAADVVEISPEVVEASGWFAAENRNVLQDPRTRLIVGDARSHFRMAARRYDVIISEPSNPWMAGVAALFTREFFDTLRARLTPGGLACQWAHTYDISGADLRSIVATFASAFPEVTLWLIGDGDLLMVGGDEAERRLRSLTGTFPAGPARDLGNAGLSSAEGLRSLLLGGTAFARSWAAGAALQSDDRMALEFSTPRRIVGRSVEDHTGALLEASSGFAATAAAARDAGLFHLRSRAVKRAWTMLDRAVALGAGDGTTLEGYARAAALTGQLQAAEARLQQLAERDAGNPAAHLELARVLAARGEMERARDEALAAWRLEPGQDAAERLAAIAADAQDLEGLSSAVELLARYSSDGHATLYYRATLAYLAGKPAEAAGLARRAAELNPKHAASWTLLGAARAASGAPPDSVREAFTQAVTAEPSDALGYVNLATLELEQGRFSAAADLFAEALTLDPANKSAREGLERARRTRG
jgi:spermidine synthase